METKNIDNSLFTKLFLEEKEQFERIAYSYVGSHELAKDLVMDAYLTLWEKRMEIDADLNMKGFLYIVVKNTCLSYLRKAETKSNATEEIRQKKNWKIETAIHTLSNDSINDDILSGEVISLYRTALRKMPEITRKIFKDSREVGLTYNEIALKHNITVRKVTYEVQKALNVLKETMKDYIIHG